MRPIKVVLILAASAAQWACADETPRTETAAAHARDSALTHDLVLAGYDSAAVARVSGGVDTTSRAPTVTQSAGDLAAPNDATGLSVASAAAGNSSDASASSVEGYIGPSCVSPAKDDQQRCLKGYLARSDMRLDHSYQALISQLRAEAGTHVGAPDPPIAQRLRTAQRNWLVYRDDECRKRSAPSEGPLWAPVRARCLAEYSALRERELSDALSQRKPVVARSAPAKPKVTKHTRRAKAKRRSRR